MGDKQISDEKLVEIIEAAIFVAGKPLSRMILKETVLDEFNVSLKRIKQCLEIIEAHYSTRGIQLVEVGSGYRFQASKNLSPWLSKLFQDKTPKYSRALLETLSLIAYRQPITRGEIEQVRGVAVSSHIIKSLLERHWIKAVGHKEVPGRPALYATTKDFLDYFSLAGLDSLPPLPDLQGSKINQMISSL
ncbi:SMC-Scp complex subunit ScpB [Pseudoalteromonas denitrificans]|uniref:Condensin subunit ScpB n=1 Tax=Pseudoalteromonas denitrificans DSM 6059 TaxID=1123010 RepID=A0A1I1QTZ1_9GAMM|nr:SMC-Scp complex subunit ScpB [Pseudoalteromonas denitrificans]SFD25581.1 condensin subunit ScpB [Pseudoalteromonas denitrificans DSM 6059]